MIDVVLGILRRSDHDREEEQMVKVLRIRLGDRLDISVHKISRVSFTSARIEGAYHLSKERSASVHDQPKVPPNPECGAPTNYCGVSVFRPTSTADSGTGDTARS